MYLQEDVSSVASLHGQHHGPSHRVVLNPAADLFGSYTRVYTDHFYSVTELFEVMRAAALLACGTAHANQRRLPKKLLPCNVVLERGKYMMAHRTA